MNAEQLLLGQRLLYGKSFTTSNSKERIQSNINQGLTKFYSRQFFSISTSLFGEPTPANQGFGVRGGITGLVC